MRPRRTRAATAAVGMLVAVGVIGCGGSASSPASKHQGTEPTVSSARPSPFTVVARYSAKSLGLNSPRALAIGPDGNLYVTDRSQRVTVISAQGKVLERWGTRGGGPGQFRFVASDPSDPTDTSGKIAVGSNDIVYVSDSGNGRVQLFTARGRFIGQFGTFGSRKGQFLSPFDLAVDDQGNVFVADDALLTVSKFSPGGKLVWEIGGAGSSNPELAGHFHLASIDSHGRLIMINDDNGKVLYVDPHGHVVDSFEGSGGVFPGGTAGCEVTVDASGYTYVTGCGPGPTLVFDRTHRLIAQWPRSNGALRRSPSFGPNGEIFALAWDDSILRLRITLPGG